MTDVPTTWEDLLEWCVGPARYNDMFVDLQRWIAEPEARATAAERDRCLGLALVTYDDIAELFPYETVGKIQDVSVALNRIIHTRIAPLPPVDELVLTITDELMQGGVFLAAVANAMATRIAAAIRAMEAKNV
jgi:hypothetical protein